MLVPSAPRDIAILVASCTLLPLLGLLFWRARYSRYPWLLYVCAAYMALLHGVWIVGLLRGPMFASGFATLELLTFPWSMAVVWNMTMAGFVTTHDLLLNYARFVLGFGGLQSLALVLFTWELKLEPRDRQRAVRARSESS